MKILIPSQVAKTTRPVRFEISSSRNTAEGPRNRATISATSAANRSPTPAGATINVASRSPLHPSSSPSAMEQAACRTPIVRKGMAQVEQKKREREREGGGIGRRDTNLYSCKIKSHRRSARLGETDQPGRPMQLICIKNRLFRPISCSATLAGTGQSG